MENKECLDLKTDRENEYVTYSRNTLGAK